MDNHRNSTSNAIGLCLLPQELIQNIFLSLVLPEIVRLKLVNKSFSRIISDHTFIRQCNSLSSSTTWLFVYKKRWLRDAVLHAFTNRSSDRWFRIPISELLKPVQFHGEDLYFLAASANVFLFASNTVNEVIAVNLVTVTVKKIPPSPLGPRGTSSWRRSGMKLVTDHPGSGSGSGSGSGHFRFMFAEFVGNRPVLFVYNSETDTWKSTEAKENSANEVSPRGGGRVFLNVVHGPRESVLVACTPECDAPMVLRPRFVGRGSGGNDDGRLTVGFSWGNVIDRLHVYGDGYMMIVKSEGVVGNRRVLKGVELWGLSLDGRKWEFVSTVPCEVMKVIEKPYGVMMGCLEEKNGIVMAALVSNCEGFWDMIWLSFDTKWNRWNWIPLPDCKMKGWNMAGISFSSGLTLP